MCACRVSPRGSSFVLGVIFLASGLGAAACGAEDEEGDADETGGNTATGGQPFSGAGGDTVGGIASGGGGAGGMGGEEAATPSLVNGCDSEAAFVDLTAAGAARSVDWVDPTGACLRIAVGQSVTWTGNFAAHPLAPWEGDAPNPITDHAGAIGDHPVTFATTGTFGFRCDTHRGTMRGAIWVVP